ncbi:MAG: alpha/beta hydrolase family protein, partial [Proteobacteria bacterium]|nr:alpha/beta hydrolase family protein [Pseudomonadota bacterium]
MKEKISLAAWKFAGGVTDEAFLMAPRVLRRVLPRRKVDEKSLGRETRFYLDKGFTDDPKSFFSLAETAPEIRNVSRKPYGPGFLEEYVFPSEYEPKNPWIRDRYLRHEANREARLFRWTHGDRPRDTVLCLHGFLLGDHLDAQRMFKVRRLMDRGLDAVLFVAPFHGKRSDGNFSSQRLALRPEDPAFTCEFFGQAVQDISATLLILEKLGMGRVGLIGASMGGYLTALYSCLAGSHAFAAMVVPALDMARPFGPEPSLYSFRPAPALLADLKRVWTFHSPMRLSPLLPPEKILILAARGDRLCPFEFTQR